MNEADARPRPFHIRIASELTHPQVLALLEEHLAGMRAASPPECVFALDLDGLRIDILDKADFAMFQLGTSEFNSSVMVPVDDTVRRA